MKNLLKKSKEKFYLVAAGVTSYFMMNPAFVYAVETAENNNIVNAVTKARNGISGTVKGALGPIVAIIFVIMGILLFVGGERTKETIKTKAGFLFLGVALVIFGTSFANTILGWFNK